MHLLSPGSRRSSAGWCKQGASGTVHRISHLYKSNRNISLRKYILAHCAAREILEKVYSEGGDRHIMTWEELHIVPRLLIELPWSSSTPCWAACWAETASALLRPAEVEKSGTVETKVVKSILEIHINFPYHYLNLCSELDLSTKTILLRQAALN